MFKVIKQSQIVHSEDVVVIPDYAYVPLNTGADGDNTSEDSAAPELLDPTAAAQITADEIIANAQQVSANIIVSANRERDEILRQAAMEAEVMRREIEDKAYNDAYSVITNQAGAAIAETREAVERLAHEQREYFESYSSELKFLTLEICQKVIGTAINEDSEALAGLVRQAVSKAKTADWCTVELSDRLSDLIAQLSKEFSSQSGSRQIEVVGVSSPIDSCILKTDEGVVDASVSTQLENIRLMFQNLDSGSR